jgi:hypothetical protein
MELTEVRKWIVLTLLGNKIWFPPIGTQPGPTGNTGETATTTTILDMTATVSKSSR